MSLPFSVVETNTLPPIPKIQSAQTREQIFTHSSLTAKRRGEFEAPRDNPSRDNEELAHIGDQVVSLAITDLIHGRYPLLRVGPTSVRRCIVPCIVSVFSPLTNQQLRSRIKRGSALAEIAVQYGLHESLRTQFHNLKASQSVQVDVFKAYVGGLFREQGMDAVKQWLDPLFAPPLDVAYWAERRNHLVPGPASPATTSRTPNNGRKREELAKDGGDADAPDSGSSDWPDSAPRRRSLATAELADMGTRKRRRSR
ncbi:ribonuclease III domain-containing protein [Lactarius indigo]|nr:ribonuclease III domain-containing protein [Lactarius indigo]